MFAVELRRGQETRRFSLRVAAGSAGWELSEETNHRTIRTVRYTDWHRVERAITLMRMEAATLEENGWAASAPL